MSKVIPSAPVTLERHGPVALLRVDNPPVNAISHRVLRGLREGIDQALAAPETAAIILLCAGDTFFAGADISEFGEPEPEPGWAAVDRRIDLCPVPVIAAIHRRAFGGGLEFALACHYRLAEEETVFAFPEVTLGLIPGAGGTQRFPRLAGCEKALDIISTGRRFGLDEALSFGLIDATAPPGGIESAALEFARALIREGKTEVAGRRIALRTPPVSLDRAALFASARDRVRRDWRDSAARLTAVDAIEFGLDHPFDAAMAHELKLFEARVNSPEHRALTHLFFAKREAFVVPDLPRDPAPPPVGSAAVIGAGTMGRGIALCLVTAGIPTMIIETSAERLEAALDHCRHAITSAEKRGRIAPEEAGRRIAELSGTTDPAAVGGADLVIEAVPEDMTLKQSVFARIAALAAPGALLASNTSTLDLDQIAAATGRAGDVIGLHFFSPAEVMPLLEIVRGRDSSDRSLRRGLALARQLRKQAVVSRVCDGFIANRAFEGYWREAEFLVAEGAGPAEVDTALEEFGMAMGPFAVADLVGLDIGRAIRRRQREKHPPGTRLPEIEDLLCDAGRLGRKSGAGWYLYADGARKGIADPAVAATIRDYRAARGITPREIGREEIVRRCIFAVICEGARILEEGIALRASDIDVAAVEGMGFPAWRGGPMHYANEAGPDQVLAAIAEFARGDGYWWRVAPLFQELAASGGHF